MTRGFRNLLFVFLFLAGCSGTSAPGSPSSGPVGSVSTASVNKADYPVFLNADAGADPSVPAEQGGKGFTGEGWETSSDFDLIGDPRALKGGLFRRYTSDFPGTLRMQGPEWSSNTNYAIGRMVYETLLMLHPTTLDYMPSLATHWQISPDKLTYRFRLDPNAKFSDGAPVTADDVVASWKFYTDKSANDPAFWAKFTELETPVAESKYTVAVKSKKVAWKTFLSFATDMLVFPSAVLKNVDGKAYLRDYNFKYLPGTGPYIVNEADVVKGQSISLRRRKDYWAEGSRRAAGLNNFDEVRLVVVRDSGLALEKFKKGELDFHYANRSKDWVVELDFDKVDRGLILKRKVFNYHPDGFQGFPMNTRRPLFADVRVRKALTLLVNRELMIEKLFYKEYLPIDSYFPGTVYENPANPKNVFNPQEAVKLLSEAGWKTRDGQGRLTKDGKRFEFEMLYDSKQSESYLTVYQEDLKNVGITMNLRLVTFETAFKLVYGRQFDMTEAKWGGANFPDPDTMFHSRLADVNDNDNITGFKDPRIDEICEKYGRAFDLKERTALIKELDGILASQYHYALHWYPPAERIAFWNKFGYPAGYLTRTGEYESGLFLGPGIEMLWWIDPAKEQALRQAMADTSKKLEAGDMETRFWQKQGVSN